MRFYFALLVLLVTLPFPTLNAQCVPSVNSVQYERFSSVTEVKTLENKPSALLAGIELVLEEKSDRVSATLRDYEGTPTPLTARLEGQLRASDDGRCNIKLSGHNERGRVEIEGVIGVAAFRGTIIRKIGKNIFSHSVSLRRQSSEMNHAIGSVDRRESPPKFRFTSSCWDRPLD